MRATLFVQEGPVEAKVIDSSKSHMFVVLELNAVEFFFPGYGQENVDYVRDLIEKLTVAVNSLQDKVFEEMCSPEELDPITHQKLTRTEMHQGQADMGRDTWDEHDEKV
jgi:hypothetical protein